MEVFLIDDEPVFLTLMILPGGTLGNVTIYSLGVAETLEKETFKKEYGYRWNTILC